MANPKGKRPERHGKNPSYVHLAINASKGDTAAYNEANANTELITRSKYAEEYDAFNPNKRTKCNIINNKPTETDELTSNGECARTCENAEQVGVMNVGCNVAMNVERVGAPNIEPTDMSDKPAETNEFSKKGRGWQKKSITKEERASAHGMKVMSAIEVVNVEMETANVECIATNAKMAGDSIEPNEGESTIKTTNLNNERERKDEDGKRLEPGSVRARVHTVGMPSSRAIRKSSRPSKL